MKKLLTLILALTLACGVFAAGSFAETDTDDDPQMYYIPGVSQYYHADPNCRVVSSRLRPMQASFLLSDAFMYGLNPCKTCNAPKPVPVAYTPAELIKYEVLADGTAAVIGVDESVTTCNIPAELDGHTVTAIGEAAFQYNKQLTAVTLPSTVTAIESEAFENCCNLTSINIPAAVTRIDPYAFIGTSSLTSIRIAPNHPFFAVNNDALIGKNEMTLIKYLGKNNGVYEIEQGIKGIGVEAFMGSLLTSVVIPDSVVSVDTHAFSYMDNLDEIILPEGVTKLGTQAFFFSKLKSLKIPASLTSIGDSCFDWCNSLKHVEIAPENPVYEMRDNLLVNKTKNALVYHLDTDKDTYEVPDGFKYICESAFFNTSLKEVIFPDSVEDIDRAVFFQAGSLESVRLPAGLKRISNVLFSHCISMKSIVIPDGVETIESDAFFNCYCLEEVVIPASVTRIADDAFEGCPHLTVKAPAVSYAQIFCDKNNIKFEAME